MSDVPITSASTTGASTATTTSKPSPPISAPLTNTSSRPSTPTSSTNRLPSALPFPISTSNPPQHHRRPSTSSLTSSRRASLLTPPFEFPSSASPSASPSGPQRLPRQPSSDFAELHNELEIEQEAAVNRLLNMIRLQQIHNQHLAVAAAASDDGASSTGATFDSANSTRARSPGGTSSIAGGGGGGGRKSGLSRQSSFNQNRPISRASSTHTSSPMLAPVGGVGIGEDVSGGFLLGGSRDETSFYMAETQMLTRENEMLKRRIKELERQVRDLTGLSVGEGGVTAPAAAAAEEKSPTDVGTAQEKSEGGAKEKEGGKGESATGTGKSPSEVLNEEAQAAQA